MAIAVNGGHVSRAIDFYNSIGKYFIVGGTQPWDDEANPTNPQITDFHLRDVIGLKKVENAYLVIPDQNGTIEYRNQKWKIITTSITTKLTSDVSTGATSISVESVEGLTTGSKVRIGKIYEAKITDISGTILTLDTASPSLVLSNTVVTAGAQVEGAKYVYVECKLRGDEFPLQTYRQIGLCTAVTPNTEETLLAAAYSTSGNDEFTSLGILEILDNRKPQPRSAEATEHLSIIIEF